VDQGHDGGRENDGLTTVDLFTDPAHIQKAKAEFDQKRGRSFVYKTRLADRNPRSTTGSRTGLQACLGRRRLTMIR
jgi:hypothetical protein